MYDYGVNSLKIVIFDQFSGLDDPRIRISYYVNFKTEKN